MRRALLTFVLALAAAFVVLAAPRIAGAVVIYEAAVNTGDPETGVDGASMSTSPVTDPISLGDTHKLVTLMFYTTPGTSLVVAVSCEESYDGSASSWAWISHATDAAASTGAKGVVTFAIDGGVTAYSLEVKAIAPWLRCTFDDPADGNGTVIVRVVVSDPNSCG